MFSMELLQLDPVERRVWAHRNSVYQFVTIEMIQALKTLIGGRTAIEICGGNGALGRELGIPSTDSYIHTEPKGIDYAFSRGERPVVPGADVMRMEANEAVSYGKPKVVIGAFVPQQYQHIYGNCPNPGPLFGVDEELLLRKVETYILLGNLEVDHDRRIFSIPHKTYRPPWQVTRYENQSQNYMWVWDKRDFKHH